MMRRSRPTRGFTLVEMMTAVAILGIILLLIGYEFDHSLEHLLHTGSNQDLESSARLTLSKVTNTLRSASPLGLVTPTPGPPPTPDPLEVIVQPSPATSPTAAHVLSFYRVRPGVLANPAAIPSPGDAPSVPYDIVTIQTGPNPCNPGCKDPSTNYLVETVADAVTGAPESAVVLGKNVTDFTVTAAGTPDAAQVDITLTVSDLGVPGEGVTGTQSRCAGSGAIYQSAGPNCSYTTSSSIWVGGASSE